MLPPVLHELFRGNAGTNEALDSAVDMAKPPLFPSQFRSFDVRNSGLFLTRSPTCCFLFFTVCRGNISKWGRIAVMTRSYWLRRSYITAVLYITKNEKSGLNAIRTVKTVETGETALGDEA